MTGVFKIVVFVLGIALFAGCASSRITYRIKPVENAFEQEDAEFTELKNGQTIDATLASEDLAKAKYSTKGKVTVKGTEYPLKDIVAFQRANKYYRRTTDGIFSERIVKGNINVFRSGEDYYFYTYYIQKGSTGNVIPYESKELKKMIQDHQPSLDEYIKFETMSANKRVKEGSAYIDRVIALYNSK